MKSACNSFYPPAFKIWFSTNGQSAITHSFMIMKTKQKRSLKLNNKSISRTHKKKLKIIFIKANSHKNIKYLRDKRALQFVIFSFSVYCCISLLKVEIEWGEIHISMLRHDVYITHYSIPISATDHKYTEHFPYTFIEVPLKDWSSFSAI